MGRWPRQAGVVAVAGGDRSGARARWRRQARAIAPSGVFGHGVHGWWWQARAVATAGTAPCRASAVVAGVASYGDVRCRRLHTWVAPAAGGSCGACPARLSDRGFHEKFACETKSDNVTPSIAPLGGRLPENQKHSA